MTNFVYFQLTIVNAGPSIYNCVLYIWVQNFHIVLIILLNMQPFGFDTQETPMYVNVEDRDQASVL